MTGDRVCPECGEPAGEAPFCASCGLNLTNQARLPTRSDWEAAQTPPPPPPQLESIPSAQPTTGVSRSNVRIAGAAVAIVALLGAGAWFLLLRNKERYVIPSGSMYPTYAKGDEVTADTGDTDPEVGDVIIFHPPIGATSERCGDSGTPPPPGQVCSDAASEADEDSAFIKRVVAGPGDTLKIIDGHAIVNGEQVDDSFTEPCTEGDQRCNFPKEVTIADDHYFVLGDNRGASDDSRFWGPVPGDWIIGTVTD